MATAILGRGARSGLKSWRRIDLQGEVDYLLKVRVTDAKAYDSFYQSLIAEVKIFKVTALLSMEEIKYSTVLSLPS